jgi:hypothetical protein
MKLGKGLKVRMKCPLCSQLASINPATTRNQYLVYSCYRCGIEWRIKKGWKQHFLQQRRATKEVKRVGILH